VLVPFNPMLKGVKFVRPPANLQRIARRIGNNLASLYSRTMCRGTTVRLRFHLYISVAPPFWTHMLFSPSTVSFGMDFENASKSTTLCSMEILPSR